jgi:hypothetical protein
MIKNVTLYRPTGADELALIIDSGMKRFLPEARGCGGARGYKVCFEGRCMFRLKN